MILEHLACYIYCNILRLLPALARQWWNSSDCKVSNIIDKLTVTYVSHLICKEEIEAVQEHQTKDEHMQVKVNAAYEVLAIYTVDEVNMEILISLPYNYPLGPVKVMSRKEICGTNQWRTWVRQLTLFLTHQNGNIWDGLTQWKSNLDKRFDGVEECYVCYSVVHASTHQLPKSTCKTCRKKFHSQCLYKWFNTSNKSTCPICRNMF
uniref:E3 ubiquitin-protein ligase listerin n=1 Tax=Xenopsylla cheopis TaxID=163159 RepID=A0A6M2DZX6_XENCH